MLRSCDLVWSTEGNRCYVCDPMFSQVGSKSTASVQNRRTKAELIVDLLSCEKISPSLPYFRRFKNPPGGTGATAQVADRRRPLKIKL